MRKKFFFLHYYFAIQNFDHFWEYEEREWVIAISNVYEDDHDHDYEYEDENENEYESSLAYENVCDLFCWDYLNKL